MKGDEGFFVMVAAAVLMALLTWGLLWMASNHPLHRHRPRPSPAPAPAPYYVTGRHVGIDLARSVGLATDNLIGFELRCYAEEAVKIQAEYFVTGEQVGTLDREFKNYNVCEVADHGNQGRHAGPEQDG